METASKVDSSCVPADGANQPGVAKPWVKSLLAGQSFSLPESVQFWWSVHLEAFLRYARKRGPEVALEQLIADYLTGLRLDQPGVGVRSPVDGLGTWMAVKARLPFGGLAALRETIPFRYCFPRPRRPLSRGHAKWICLTRKRDVVR